MEDGEGPAKRLSGEDIDALSRLLATAYNLSALEIAVHVSTGDRLFVEYVAPGKPLRPTIADLLNALEERGATARFLAHSYRNFPARADVRSGIAQRCPAAVAALAEPTADIAAQTRGQPQERAPPSANAPGLQRNVRPHLTKVDVRVWLERLAEIERRVCRVEINGNAAGTGFLVGPEVVLTNWHVVEAAQRAGRINEVMCKFGYLRLPDGTRQSGTAIALHADGCLDSSPYAPAEKTGQPETPLPTADELDYALLRLAVPAGHAEIEGRPRGWITLPTAPVALDPHTPLLIVQHPDGAPMKLALDTDAVIGTNANGTRIRYTTNTDPGSSGSPCFSMDWDLVALHHYGDPAWAAPKFNQGVPIGMIRSRIVARGAGAFL
jgi:Trypsin-like peptidase domain